MARYRPMTTGPRRTKADAVEAAVAGTDRSSSLLGVTALADLLGRDRGTISSWIDKGCPVARRGGTGERTLLDPAQVFAWREQFARDEEARKYARPSGDPLLDGAPMKPADLLKLEQLKLTRLKVGQSAELLIPRDLAEAAFERAMGLVRQAVMAIPERLSREMAGFPEERVLGWREKALAQCRSALREGAKSIETVMPDFRAPE